MSDQDIIDDYKKNKKLDPSDEMPDELTEICEKRAKEWMQEKPARTSKELNLMEEQFKVPGQRYALVSFIGPNCSQKSDKLAMKIYGVFDNTEAAGKRAKSIHDSQREDDVQYHIFIQELYNWCPIPPQCKNIDEQYYDNDYLNDMINKHKENERIVKEQFNLRKDILMGEENVNKDLLLEQAGVEEEKKEEITATEMLKALEET